MQPLWTVRLRWCKIAQLPTTLLSISRPLRPQWLPEYRSLYPPFPPKSETKYGTTVSSPPPVVPFLSTTVPRTPWTTPFHPPSSGPPLAVSSTPPGLSFVEPHRSDFSKPLHLVPCAPTTATPLSSSLLPLAHPLPLVNRQLYTETSRFLWRANTLVLPDYAATQEVLEYLGKAGLGVQRVELVIGNVWDLRFPQIALMMETLKQLALLVCEGSLMKLRLQYVDGGAFNRTAFQIWIGVLINSMQHSDWEKCYWEGCDWEGCDWEGCEREVVWEEDKMRTDWLRKLLAKAWGLDGALWTWKEDYTDEDWMHAKESVASGEWRAGSDLSIGCNTGSGLRNDSR